MLLFPQRLAKQAPGFGLKTAVDDIRASEARVTIMVLDACRDNPLTPPGGRSLGGEKGLRPPPPSNGLLIHERNLLLPSALCGAAKVAESR